MYNTFNGPWSSSTRCEIAAMIVALLAPMPVRIASDSAAALGRASHVPVLWHGGLDVCLRRCIPTTTTTTTRLVCAGTSGGLRGICSVRRQCGRHAASTGQPAVPPPPPFASTRHSRCFATHFTRGSRAFGRLRSVHGTACGSGTTCGIGTACGSGSGSGRCSVACYCCYRAARGLEVGRKALLHANTMGLQHEGREGGAIHGIACRAGTKAPLPPLAHRQRGVVSQPLHHQAIPATRHHEGGRVNGV